MALTPFRLNGQFLSVAEELARPAGMTAAWWQVLGAVLHRPLPVAGIARAMGITRQSVQRIADLLVDAGLAEYQPNPAHRRAKLLEPTAAGTRRSGHRSRHAAFAGRLAEHLGIERFARALDALIAPLRRPRRGGARGEPTRSMSFARGRRLITVSRGTERIQANRPVGVRFQSGYRPHIRNARNGLTSS